MEEFNAIELTSTASATSGTDNTSGTPPPSPPQSTAPLPTREDIASHAQPPDPEGSGDVTNTDTKLSSLPSSVVSTASAGMNNTSETPRSPPSPPQSDSTRGDTASHAQPANPEGSGAPTPPPGQSHDQSTAPLPTASDTNKTSETPRSPPISSPSATQLSARSRGESYKEKHAGRCHNREPKPDMKSSQFNNVLLTIMLISLIVVTVALWLVGASVASVGKDNLKLLNRSVCSKMDHDPPNRFANENIYAWYIVYTGIFVLVFSITLCICCASFAGLSFWNSTTIAVIKAMSIVGCFIGGIGAIFFTGWISLGTYLLTTISPDNLHEPLCNNLIIYLVALYISLVTFLVACVVGCHWTSNRITENGKMVV